MVEHKSQCIWHKVYGLLENKGLKKTDVFIYLIKTESQDNSWRYNKAIP